jgi:hypothetical protein
LTGTAERGSTLTILSATKYLVLTVMLGVMTAGFGVMLFGMAGMAVSGVGVMPRLLVIAGFMMLGSFAMMLCRVLVMFGSLVMVIDACVVAHGALPVCC